LSEQEVLVPDIGDFDDVEVIDVLVSKGDSVQQEDALITLESDKASMDVPAPFSGKVTNVAIKTGDKVSQGSKILTLAVEGKSTGSEKAASSKETKADDKQGQPNEPEQADQPIQTAEAPKKDKAIEEKPTESRHEHEFRPPPLEPVDEKSFSKAHASPSVRRFARELGADLGKIHGSGSRGRILKEDVQSYVKSRLQAPATGIGLPSMPEVDFSKFGETETRSLTRIQKISSTNLHRNWVTIPHVTQFDEADITDLEAFRKQQKAVAEKQDIKLTMLPFLMKACASALKAFPDFNASLHPNGEQLIVKKYIHIGVAVDTPDGLLVPVIRDVDKKGVFALAKELMEVSQKARDKKLSPNDMQGACFSISNLGGVGGTSFTPIINAPEVAILGVSRSEMKPVYIDGEFQPRLMLPLSLSYDHRVIDGAKAARFTSALCDLIADMRRVLL
jgi:pyruvate dehydrogenase E2 component (dihydrolipoamide acetyltransferase)